MKGTLLASLFVTLALAGCSTRWSTTQLRPPPPGQALRLRVIGNVQWLPIRHPTIEGDTAITWTPEADDLRKVPEELRELFWSGRVAMRDVTDVQVADLHCDGVCVGGLGLGATVVVALGVTYIILRVFLSSIFGD